MATKRAASRKPKATVVTPTFEPLEKIFDKAKTVMVMKLETSRDISRRVDNLMSVRDSAYKFWGNQLDDRWMMKERMDLFRHLQDVTTNTYEKMLDLAKEFDLEEFKKEDMKDYFEGLIPSVEELENENDLLDAALVFQCVQPYGSQMNQIHQLIMEEIEKRAAYEENDAAK